MTKNPDVIVGGGLAGAKAAAALREEGFDGPIVLIGEEPELPYARSRGTCSRTAASTG